MRYAKYACMTVLILLIATVTMQLAIRLADLSLRIANYEPTIERVWTHCDPMTGQPIISMQAWSAQRMQRNLWKLLVLLSLGIPGAFCIVWVGCEMVVRVYKRLEVGDDRDAEDVD